MKKTISLIFLGLLIIFLGIPLAGFAQLSPPDLISPSDGETDVPLSTTLTWSLVSGAAAYIVEINGVARSTVNTSYSINLAPETTYSWRVRSCESTGWRGASSDCGEYSVERYFTSQECPEGETKPYNECIGEVEGFSCLPVDICGVSKCETSLNCIESLRDETLEDGTPEDGTPGTPGTPGTSQTQECPPGQICNPLKYDKFGDLVDAIINFIFWVAMALAPLMIVIAGVMFVTAGGNPLQVEKARKLILYTVIGLAIILLAKGLISVLENVLGVEKQ